MLIATSPAQAGKPLTEISVYHVAKEKLDSLTSSCDEAHEAWSEAQRSLNSAGEDVRYIWEIEEHRTEEYFRQCCAERYKFGRLFHYAQEEYKAKVDAIEKDEHLLLNHNEYLLALSFAEERFTRTVVSGNTARYFIVPTGFLSYEDSDDFRSFAHRY